MTEARILAGGLRAALRLERHFADPPEVVWAAITDRDELRSWFPCDVDVVGGSWEVGATILFRFAPQVMDTPLEGRVLAVETAKLLSYTWGEEILRFELTVEGSGTRLVLIDELPAGIAARNAAGWEQCLDLLEPPRQPSLDWRGLFEKYSAEFSPSLGPQDEPPPGYKSDS